MKKMVAPSLLAADFSNLSKDIEIVNQSEADWFHLDIMDGVFVPNISFGIPVVEAVKKHAQKPLDVHLMIVQPEKYITAFRDAGADLLNVHYEASPHLHRTVQEIHNAGMKAGVTINPHTPVALLEDIIEMVDLVLIMSVNPGFGGQKFIEHTFHRVEQLRNLINKKNSKALIEVDGGVSTDNSAQLYEAGADVLVSGSFIFKSDDPVQTISELKK
ncbi:ribulose-phosphate 3-epimerase [Marinilabilia salmonicolor]|jgi:ribulose-phosphate 3-epimerase|uniref:Ribulose-phosphate 3-epimerase n=1 Tax=Marinilabilia salmonicolor TaxID=989 RepID=A0A368V6G8_9BACT|nr:ribulose-phosphate 3-epimerase [Marinilabilia salmonicolor]RCW36747.1 ribulose-phosphate 3-epimerase [Marinilabilia salmonicolor]